MPDASVPDAPVPDESIPEMPEEFGEFPPMDLGEDAGLDEITHDLGVDGFPEDNGLEGLDIFAVNKGPEETSAADETGVQSGPGDGIPDVEEPAACASRKKP